MTRRVVGTPRYLTIDDLRNVPPQVVELSYEANTFTHEGRLYDLRALNAELKNRAAQPFALRDLTWIFQYDDPTKDHPERIKRAHLSIPVIVTPSAEGLVVLDGLHRCKKAEMLGMSKIQGKLATRADLKACHLSETAAYWRRRVEKATHVYATALVECTASYDLGIHTNPDAEAWARFFMRCNPGIVLRDGDGNDVTAELMFSWFANAMMAMHDHMLGGGPLNGDHAQYLLDHPETASDRVEKLRRAGMLPNSTTVRWGEFDLIGLLTALRKLGQIGASRDVVVSPDDEPQRFGFDGDGRARIEFDEPETASGWNDLTVRERRSYLRKNPRATLADLDHGATRLAVETHLRSQGYHPRGRTWHHARSGAEVAVESRHVVASLPGRPAQRIAMSRPGAVKRAIRTLARHVPRKHRRSWND